MSPRQGTPWSSFRAWPQVGWIIFKVCACFIWTIQRVTPPRLAIFLRGYKSGPLPKLFKVIPSLPAWARILALTKPEQWSPHACRAATRIFVSTMKPPQAQLFLSVVLLDAIREDIQSQKKLNVQYYECLKRALYKPGAFFKGIVFPMLEVWLFTRSWLSYSVCLLQGGCTLKEAAIVASVVAKKKVPVLHSAAALLRIAQMDYTGWFVSPSSRVL